MAIFASVGNVELLSSLNKNTPPWRHWAPFTGRRDLWDSVSWANTQARRLHLVSIVQHKVRVEMKLLFFFADILNFVPFKPTYPRTRNTTFAGGLDLFSVGFRLSVGFRFQIVSPQTDELL